MTAAGRRFTPEFLQWFGLFGAALTWTAQLVLGFGVAVARCGAANAVLGVDLRSWQLSLLGVGVALVLLAEAAALETLWETRAAHYDDAAPDGRRHFFAVAAVLGNLLFLVAIVLGGVAVVVHQPPCQSA
jgi:hypothetical protein